MDAYFSRQNGGILIPLDNNAKHFVASLAVGEGVRVQAFKVTDMRIHRKMFALLNLAFECWEPNDDLLVIGESRRKDFDHFRNRILILAGHYDVVYKSTGTFMLVARSLSTNLCDGYRFEQVYRAVLDVVWTRVLRHIRYASPEEADRVVDELISFD